MLVSVLLFPIGTEIVREENVNNNLEHYRLLQTVVETEQELSAWAQRLSSNYYLELGSNPTLIKEIERDLKQLTDRLGMLNPHFDLARVPARKANAYFAAAGQLENAVSLVREIRQEAYGSPQNTRRCLEQLELCVTSIREMSHIIAPGFSLLPH